MTPAQICSRLHHLSNTVCSISSLQTTPPPTPPTSCPLGQIQALPRTQAHNYPPEAASAGRAAHKPSSRPTKAHGAKGSFSLVLSHTPSRSLPPSLYRHVGIPSIKGWWVTFLLYLTHYHHAAPTWNTHQLLNPCACSPPPPPIYTRNSAELYKVSKSWTEFGILRPHTLTSLPSTHAFPVIYVCFTMLFITGHTLISL